MNTKHKISDKAFNRIMFLLSFFSITLSAYVILSLYQNSRYKAADPTYVPKFDGRKWLRNPDTFNCIDFTIEAKGWFEFWGFKTYEVTGDCKDKASGHEWLGIKIFNTIVHFEPQYLTIFNPNDDFTNIHIKEWK